MSQDIPATYESQLSPEDSAKFAALRKDYAESWNAAEESASKAGKREVGDFNWCSEELEKRGFAVIRNFLSAEECTHWLSNYRESPEPAAGEEMLYSVVPCPLDKIKAAPLGEKMQALCDGLTAAGGVCQPRRLQEGYYFETQARKTAFFWHQDNDSFYLHQTHKDYINVWIPVLKPDEAVSNLEVIPIECWQEFAPEAWKHMENSGARWVHQFRNKNYIVDEAGDMEPIKLGALSPSDMSFCAHMRLGDAFVMRGDMMHKTQEAFYVPSKGAEELDAMNIARLPRVSLSVRCFNPDHIITKKAWEHHNDVKSEFVDAGWGKIVDEFFRINGESAPVGRALDFFEAS